MALGSMTARTTVIALGLVLLVVFVYGRTVIHPFVDLDDGEYVYENSVVQGGLSWRGIAWAFTTTHAANWHPLTWLSHMADVEMFGLNAGGHHLTSGLIHALNAVLLLLVLRDMTGAVWRSGLVAALFAVHPLHVESVAWVAERKDVLSTFFWLLALMAYARYVRTPGVGRSLGVATALALGLLCKPMLMSLPFVLLLLDYWPLGRLARGAQVPRLVREKLPLFALAALSGVVTYLAQSSKSATASFEDFPFAERASNAVVSSVVYLTKTIWPASLAVYYPHPSTVHEAVPAWQVIAAAAVLGALSWLALSQARRRPYLAVGWLWYLVSLVPVIGLVQVGSQALADRYTYVPLVGIFVAGAWGAPDAWQGWRYRRHVLATLGAIVILALSVAAWIQVGYWSDGVTLYTHAIAVTRKNWLAWNNLGMQHLNSGRFPGALACFMEAARIKPDYADAWYNAGVALGRLQQYPRAIAAYQEALRLDPENADGWANLALAYQATGRSAQAIGAYQRLRAVDPAKADELTRSIPGIR